MATTRYICYARHAGIRLLTNMQGLLQSRHLEVRAAVVDDNVSHRLQPMLVQLLYQLPQLALRMQAEDNFIVI